MTIWITSGTRPSNSRLALQRAGHFRKVRTNNQLKNNDWLINWGVADLANYQSGVNWGVKLLNSRQSVSNAANKFKSFQEFSIRSIPSVDWTKSKGIAKTWLDADKTVVVRQVLTGHSGNGILIVKPGEDLPDAPLYTRYVFKTHEYRVHIVKDNVIDVQRKIRDPNREPLDWKVRSHANGFIFVRTGVDISADIRELAVKSVEALGLDFGAVDIVVDKQGVAYILEINTAPGLEGQTVGLYATALRAACGN